MGHERIVLIRKTSDNMSSVTVSLRQLHVGDTGHTADTHYCLRNGHNDILNETARFYKYV